MALRILHNEVFAHHVGARPRHIVERLLSSAVPRPAVSADTTNQDGIQNTDQSKVQSKLITPFRTTENDPRNHTSRHAGRFYTFPEELKQTFFKHGGFPKEFNRLCDVFTETCLMVRDPFLEIKGNIERVDFSKPAVRMVLYGKMGYGKTLTLAHVVHYGFNAGYLLVHVPWVNTFIRRCVDAVPSERHPGMIDVPINAAAWLMHFRTQNQHLLQKLGLKTTKAYQYGPRDTIEVGSPIDELLEFGIGRAKYAGDVTEDLIREIKGFSNSGLVKTMVVIDGFNGLFTPYTKNNRRKTLRAKCSFALPFLEITRFDWCNGVVVLSVDEMAHHEFMKAESHLPFYLLGKEGWEHLDPFLPVPVGEWSTAELDSAIDYYIDRRWIQHPAAKSEEGRQELKLLCGNSPYELAKICAPL